MSHAQTEPWDSNGPGVSPYNRVMKKDQDWLRRGQPTYLRWEKAFMVAMTVFIVLAMIFATLELAGRPTKGSL